MRGPGCAVVVLTAVVALAVSGCSGADADGSDSTTTTAASTPTATVESTNTTIVAAPSTTSPPTATTPATTSSTSTTTTTPGPSLEELEAEVAAAYDAVYEGYWACLRAPLACDTSWLLEGSGSAEAMQNTMQALADRDRYVGDDPVGYYVIESIEFDDDFTEATVTSCWSLTAVLYSTPVDPNRPPGPDNPPTVVNNTPGSILMFELLEQNPEGRWVLSSARAENEVSEVDQCRSDG